ncbi:hypothetical protein [Microvirga guangxiensis]|uniref:Uncharacterized protein n=1 Tax=Microvirga guangxiensis TaxID=549386 RepID=A0A1G5CRA1_9HYPH|nr:hypothetical protein [Microvirga guangxiensis]SCY04780.1 hypothetical protein SAMN02927923_00643 [Microvirga guangxiensis]
MITRFEKTLEQVAREGSNLATEQLTIESHAQKVRRLEDLIRAKEATGDRIVIGIGAALVVSAMALPVYAAFVRDSYVYLPNVGGSFASRGSLTADRAHFAAPSKAATPVSESSAAPSHESNERSAADSVWPSVTPFARYVVHRATQASALIEGPNGLWWVTPGMKIPGVGQVLSIEHSYAGWAVVTSETTITEEIAGNATN